MSWFKKKETTHFERDEVGKVVRVTRNGTDVTEEVREPVGWKSTKQLEQEYYAKHPEKKHPALKKIGGGLKKLDTKIVKYNQGRNILSSGYRPSHSSPAHNNYNPFGNLFDSGMSQPKARHPKQPKTSKRYAVVGGKAYPIVGTSKKKKGKKKSKASFGFGGFDSMDSMGFFK